MDWLFGESPPVAQTPVAQTPVTQTPVAPRSSKRNRRLSVVMMAAQEDLTEKEENKAALKIINNKKRTCEHEHTEEQDGGTLQGDRTLFFGNGTITQGIAALKAHMMLRHTTVLADFNEQTLTYIPALLQKSPLSEGFINEFGPSDGLRYLLSFIQTSEVPQPSEMSSRQAVETVTKNIIKRNLFTFGCYNAETQWENPEFKPTPCFICAKQISEGEQREHLIPSALSFFLFGVNVGQQAVLSGRMGGGDIHSDFRTWIETPRNDDPFIESKKRLNDLITKNIERRRLQLANFRWAHARCNIQKSAKVIPKCFTLDGRIGINNPKFEDIKKDEDIIGIWHSEYINRPQILKETFSELFKVMAEYDIDKTINTIVEDNLKFIACLSHYLVWMEGGIRNEIILVDGFNRILGISQGPQLGGGGGFRLTLQDIKNIMIYLDHVGGVRKYNPKSTTEDLTKKMESLNLQSFEDPTIPPVSMVAGKTLHRKRTYRKKKGTKHNVQSVQSKKSTFRKRRR